MLASVVAGGAPRVGHVDALPRLHIPVDVEGLRLEVAVGDRVLPDEPAGGRLGGPEAAEAGGAADVDGDDGVVLVVVVVEVVGLAAAAPEVSEVVLERLLDLGMLDDAAAGDGRTDASGKCQQRHCG